jgi:hypothetical protein
MAPLHNRSGSRSPVFERGTLWDLLELLRRNQLEQRSGPGNSVIGPLQAFLSRMRRGDSRRAAMRHVAHHYDLPHEHYRRFLDADLQYSCAYFADPSFSLEQAREAKKRHIAANPSLICSATGQEPWRDIPCHSVVRFCSNSARRNRHITRREPPYALADYS